MLRLLAVAVAALMLERSAALQTEPTSSNDRTTVENQDPNPKNPQKPPRVNTGVGSPDTPTDNILNEGSPPLGGNTSGNRDGSNTGQPQQAGATGNFGFAGGGLQTLRLSQLIDADIELAGGEAAGTISDIVLGQNGNILYLLANRGSGTSFTIPVQAASFDFQNSRFTLPLTREQFDSLPSFSRDRFPNFNSTLYQQQLFAAYRKAGVDLMQSTTATTGGSATNQTTANAGTQNAGTTTPSATETTATELAPPTTSTSLAPDPKSARERAFERLEAREERRSAEREANDNKTKSNDSDVTARKPPINQPAHIQSDAQQKSQPPGGKRTPPTGAATNAPNRAAGGAPGNRPTPAANAPKPQNRLPGPNPAATPGKSGVPGSPPGGGVTGGSNSAAGNQGSGNSSAGNQGNASPTAGAGQGNAGGAGAGAPK